MPTVVPPLVSQNFPRFALSYYFGENSFRLGMNHRGLPLLP